VDILIGIFLTLLVEVLIFCYLLHKDVKYLFSKKSNSEKDQKLEMALHDDSKISFRFVRIMVITMILAKCAKIMIDRKKKKEGSEQRQDICY
jgi:hypothetical protein